MTILLDDDMVDSIKPGDWVEITGVYKTVANHSSMQNAIFKTIMIATGVKQINEVNINMRLHKADIQNIKQLSKRDDVFELLSKSFAPSIQGHMNIKKAVIL